MPLIFVVGHLQSAIIIPSGKSTLLHAIAGNVKHDKKISLYGKRYINNETLTGDSRIPLAFIEQEVTFFPHMTVKETLDFQVELKMGAVLRTKKERDELVQVLIDQLGLTKSANTIVGNAKVRGLSGGERKRLSIACEMISSPPVIFLDEPTSGLDSYQAAQVIETLRRLADQGKTIVSVIHQPSQHVFQLFDDLLLLSEGRLMYFGEVSKVRQYMSDLGYECESEVGTAEHILDCVSRAVGGADAEAEAVSVKRIENIASHATKHARGLVAFGADSAKKMKHIIDKTSAHPGTNVFRQFRLLLGRSARELFRGKAAILIKIVQQVSLGVIYGGIYSLGDDQVRSFLRIVASDINFVNNNCTHFVFQGINHGSVRIIKSDHNWSNEHGDGGHNPQLPKGKGYRLRRDGREYVSNRSLLHCQGPVRNSSLRRKFIRRAFYVELVKQPHVESYLHDSHLSSNAVAIECPLRHYHLPTNELAQR